MKVKVHPHKTMVNAGIEACVSVTPDKKGGRAYYMGTVYLTTVAFRVHNSGVKRAQAEQVRNVHAWLTGDLLFEFSEQNRISDALAKSMMLVTYHFNSGRFIAEDGTDVTDGSFRAAYISGRDLFISKEW